MQNSGLYFGCHTAQDAAPYLPTPGVPGLERLAEQCSFPGWDLGQRDPICDVP